MRLPICLVIALTACAAPKPAPEPVQDQAAHAGTPAVEEPIPALQLPADVKPTHYALELTIDPDQAKFSGTAQIEVMLANPRRIIWLHGLDLEVSAAQVRVDGSELEAKWEQVNDDGVVKLTLPRAIGPGKATLQFAWTRAFDPRVVGLYLAHETNLNYAFTQFEDIFARRAFPGFDEPGFKTPFDVTLVVPKADVAVANTPPVSEEATPAGWKKIRYATTLPLPTYLIAWAVGPFDVVEGETIPPNAIRSWPVPMRGIAAKGRGGELDFALKTGRELLLREEAYFGVPYAYPKLDSVAVPDYAYGAMENAGEIHYREDLLLYKEGVTSEETRLAIASVMAHEQAHQWFGDLVTMPWWTEAWLNESFATWMAARMLEEWKPEWNAAIDLQKSFNGAMSNDALVSARAIRQPLKSVKDIKDQFDGLTYEKGGAVLAMFERFVGAEKFRQGVSRYIASRAFGSGSTDDLLAAISTAAGRDVTAAFHTFLDQAGVPLVRASVSCAGKPTLTLKQSRFFPLGSAGIQDRTWQIPVCARFAIGGKVGEQCTLLDKTEDSIELPGCPDWLLPNAEGTGYFRWSMAGDDLKKLRSAESTQLSIRERISLGESLRAAVVAGSLPIGEALSALEPLARDPEGEVAVEPIALLWLSRDRLVAPEERARVEAYAARLYKPVIARLGYAGKKGESASDRRLRATVLGLLADMHEPGVLAELVKLGRAYAGLDDGKLHPEVVDPDLAGLALRAAVREGDQAIYDALEARLGTLDDSQLRGRIIAALGAVRDPARSARALALSLDPRLRKQEVDSTVWSQSSEEVTRPAAWAFVQAHFDALISLMPETYSPWLPYVANGFCDAAHAEETRAFFEPRLGKVNGMKKTLTQALEYMRLCVAEVAAQRDSARAFFAALPSLSAPPAKPGKSGKPARKPRS